MDILPNDGNIGQLYRFDDSTGWIPPSIGGGGIISIGSHLGSGGGGIYDIPVNGGGSSLGQAPPAWIVGSYAGTRSNGEQITFSIDAAGNCTGLNNGNRFSGYYANGLLTINGSSSQLVQTAAGLDTVRTDTGETVHYGRTSSGTTAIVPVSTTGTGTTAGTGATPGSSGTVPVINPDGSVSMAAAPATVLGMSPTTLFLLGAGVVAVLILTGGKDK